MCSFIPIKAESTSQGDQIGSHISFESVLSVFMGLDTGLHRMVQNSTVNLLFRPRGIGTFPYSFRLISLQDTTHITSV